MLLTIYNDIIYRPLLNLLVVFYNIIPGTILGGNYFSDNCYPSTSRTEFFISRSKAKRPWMNFNPTKWASRKNIKDNKEAQAKAMIGFV